LKIFLGRFDFVGHPLDIALRKLLLEVGLPKETQQIDRVIEAFAKRYIQCNPSLYLSEGNNSQYDKFGANSAIQTIPIF
jgi:Sec7-like guanine-nucleotide exchange factor